MTASLPTYDLNKLFATVQDSGGESMMAVMPEDDMLMMSSDTSTGDLKSASKPGSEMVDSLSAVSWSEDFSSAS